MAELLVLRAVSPSNVFTNVLPLGGDNSGHPYAVQMMADALKDGRFTGWSTGWLSGYPTGVFYPWVADVAAAILGFVMPLAVAYKLITPTGFVAIAPRHG